MPIPIKHVILDRDGVLNAERSGGGYVENWAQWHWLPGTLSALRTLSAAGVKVSIVTNQSGIGRGRVTMDDVDTLHARMLQQASRAGGVIQHVYVCPHAPEDRCDCRKPAPGLVIRAITESGVPSTETVMVGDDERDLQAARAAGVRPILVRTGKGRAAEPAAAMRGELVFDDLFAFVSRLHVRPQPASGVAP